MYAPNNATKPIIAQRPLAFSARAEKPYVSKHIADMLLRIDSLIEVSDIFEKILED